MRPAGRHQLAPATADRLASSPARIIVTGAGGWLGMAALDLLHDALGADFDRRVVGFGSGRRELRLRDGTIVPQHPLDDLGALDRAPSLLLHLAFLTKDRVAAMTEADYRAANRALSRTVLEAAGPIGVTALFVASSGAARFADDPAAAPAMRLYGALKRDDEQAFADWAERTGRSAVVARVFNVAGPYINKHQAYALAAFIVDALAGRPVEVKATRPVWRSYVALRELTSLVLALLLAPAEPVTRFDTAGETPLEMRTIARTVAALVGDGRVHAAEIDRTLPPDLYLGDRERYAALLKAHAIEPVAFDDQVRETAGDIALAAGGS